MTLREPRGHSPARIFLVISAAILASCLAAASDVAANSRACAHLAGPSKLDYLVLASIADSPHLLAMAGYRSTARQGTERRPDGEPRSIPTDN